MKDTEIIDLFWERNEDAIQETAAAYGGALHRLAYQILYSREDAEENVSDTYIKVWNAIPPQCPDFFFAFADTLLRKKA